MNRSNSRGILCALAALAIGLSAATSQAAIVFEQLTDGSNNGFFSDGNQGVNFYDNRIADNFTLLSGTSIVQVHWWGGSENFFNPDILFNANAFVISFYTNDANNLPIEPPFYTETIPVTSITATLTGNTNVAGGLEYLFVANLAAPVAIPGGVSHSLHIGALLNAPGDDAFAWHTADADNIFSGDGLGPANDGIWEPQTLDDMAFRLLDNQAGGRCCLPSGDCIIAEETACTTAGGTFAGDNTTCGNGSICRGRCCDPFGGCEVTGPVDCVAPSVFGGLGSNCNDPGVCAGRCCQPDGECTITGPGNCSLPDRFGGLGTTCTDVRVFGNPTPPTVVIVDAAPSQPSIISVGSSFTIQDLDVRVKISHTFRNDVVICLSGPGGTPTVALTDLVSCSIGGICGAELNLNAIFDDEAAAAVCASPNLSNLALPPDRILPGQSLAAFDGLNSAGDWTLQIVDDAGADVGILEDWSLLLDNGPACVGACCTGLSCTRVSSDACATAGGIYQGDTTNCSPTPCAPNGACCSNTACSLQGQLDCAAGGGVYSGDNSTCASPAPCHASCCKPDGSCDLRTIASCNAIEGGFPGALGSTCPVGSCRGRCCLPNGNCSVIPVESCAGISSPGVLNCDAVQVFQFNDVNMFMQDNPVQTPSSNVQIVETTGPLIITDLDVDLTATHAWPGDVLFRLEHLGTSVVIYDRPGVPEPPAGFGCDTDDFNIVMDDEGSGGPIETICNALPPSALSPPNYTPANPLAAFDGMDAAGEWTITSIDFFNGDNGTLLSWSLHVGFNGQACPVVGCTCFGDMNGSGGVNGADINLFASCVAGGGAGCPCGDMDHVGGATSADVTLFVNAVMTSTCGAP